MCRVCVCVCGVCGSVCVGAWVCGCVGVTMHFCSLYCLGLASTFNMTFRSVRNSPLDIYFLLDVSSSQSDVLRLLQNDLNTIGM